MNLRRAIFVLVTTLVSIAVLAADYPAVAQPSRPNYLVLTSRPTMPPATIPPSITRA